MYFDLIFFTLLIIFIVIGYKRGLVSLVLSLGCAALSFLAAMYISQRWPYISQTWTVIKVGIFGVWIQTFILFVVFSGISQWLIAKIDFEEIVVVGFASRLLGGILYGVVFSTVFLGIIGICITVIPDFAISYSEHSLIIEWLRTLFQRFDLSQLEMFSILEKNSIIEL